MFMRPEATKVGINGFGRIGRMVFQAPYFSTSLASTLNQSEVVPSLSNLIAGHLRPGIAWNQA